MAGIDSLLQVMYGFYDGLFQPLLAAGPYVSLGAFSAVLALIFSVIYWWLLDVERQQELKDKVQEKQEERKELQEEGRDDEVKEVMGDMMELNQSMMMLNIKPMLATFVFVGLFFPWLGSTYAPAAELSETGNQSYSGNLTYAGDTVPVTVTNSSDVVVEVDGSSAQPGGFVSALGVDWQVAKFSESGGGGFLFFGGGGDGPRVKFNAEFVPLPVSLPFVGSVLNWLGFYILITMPLSIVFRKMLGVA